MRKILYNILIVKVIFMYLIMCFNSNLCIKDLFFNICIYKCLVVRYLNLYYELEY